MERFAPAKLNLTLDVLGKRPDGYHDLKMAVSYTHLASSRPAERTKTAKAGKIPLHQEND